MFERFTEKSIKVVTFSQEEALGLKHSKLYPEHLLLGILREGSGIAARFLKSAGIEIETLRKIIKDVIDTRQNEDKNLSDVLAFSNSVKRVLKEAWDEARSLGANYILPEHLFLSLLSESNTSIVVLLQDFDVDVDKIKYSIVRLVERKSGTNQHPEGLHTRFVMPRHYSIPSIFEESGLFNITHAAIDKLNSTNYETLGTEQLFLALLENADSEFSGFLESEGITHHAFLNRLNSLNSRVDEYVQNECQLTPKAFFAVSSAYELAKELGSANIKPEHIILGILKEKSGLAYRILEEMGTDTAALYNKIISPIERQKPVTLTIIRLAREEARRLGHNIVGTELILLGIIGEGTGIAATVLKSLGVTIKDARIEVEKLIGYGDGYLDKEINFTPRVKKLLEIAWGKAKKFNQPRIESEHLLLGIIREKDCIAMKVLENLGVDALEIRQGILKEIETKNLQSQVNAEL